MPRSPLISPEEFRYYDPRIVVIDARPDRTAYERGHLRHAANANLNADLSAATEPGFDPARGGRHPLPSIEKWTATLGSWGIGPETPVVIYDEHDASNAAARAWWMLRAVGHRDVRVLDGGFRAAVAAALPVEKGTYRPESGAPYPAGRWMLPTADAADVDAVRAERGWRVLDVRSAPRYRGETEPFDPVAGHIPGAVNLFYEENMEAGRFKAPEKLRAMYQPLLGDVPPQKLIVHCGSGVTACHTLLALDAAGLEGAALYVGSWSEWCRNDLPQAQDG